MLPILTPAARGASAEGSCGQRSVVTARELSALSILAPEARGARGGERQVVTGRARTLRDDAGLESGEAVSPWGSKPHSWSMASWTLVSEK